MTVANDPPPLMEVYSKMSWTQKVGVIGIIVAIISGSIGVMNQLAVAEPYWFATRSFVRESIDSTAQKIEARQIVTQIYLANSERARIENEIANKQVLLEQNTKMSQGVKDSINEQIRSLLRSLEMTKGQLVNLRREQAGRRP